MTDTSTTTPASTHKNSSNSKPSASASNPKASSSKTTKGFLLGRWQQARIEDDPIIAPGYGRQSDLERLAAALNRESNNVQLPVSAVEALMKAKGRGIRSSARTAETPTRGTSSAAAATPISSAWADFMKEEGVSLTNDTTTTTSGRGARQSKSNNDESSSKPAAVPGEARTYLPLPWDTKATPAKKKARSEQAAGYLLQAGTLDFRLVGRGKLSAAEFQNTAYHLARPTVMKMPTLVTSVFSAGHAVHAICIDAAQQVYGWGRNEGQQLGSSLGNHVYWPTKLTDLDADGSLKITQAATGKSHSLFLTQAGEVYAMGSNKFGQCGVKPGPASETVGTARIGVVPTGVEMAEIACGEDFSMAVSTEGRLYSTGCSQYGQLGNGETGEYFVTANKLAFTNCPTWTARTTFCDAGADDKVVPLADTDSILVRHVACGKHHTLVMEASAEKHRARVFSFGCGDYGCLGHGVQKDEYFPRQIAALNNAPLADDGEIRLSAGNSCSLLQTSAGHVYYWGKHRSVGEATMRPQLVDVLANNQHIVKHVGAGSQTVVCSTEHAQTVAWGQGPHGELGLQTGAKSSAKPTFVDDLNNCHVISLAAGYGTLWYVVSEDDKKVVDELPQIEEAAVTELVERVDAPPAEKGKKGRKRKS